MLKVGDIHSIKRLHYSQGWGKRRISRELSIARNTVRDVLSGENDGQYTMKQPRARPVAEVIEPIVRNYLKAELEDPQPHRKQRLTAARIDELLRTQHGFSGGDRTVRRVVSKVRSELADPLQVAMVPLVYEPGRDAQVDFLEADVDYPEGRVRKTFMLVRACYSTRTFAAAVPAENQEALFEALMKSFEHFGGVFHYLWFDNLTAAVDRVLTSRKRKLRGRYESFRAYYGFDDEFCGPGKGNEKGGVEKNVDYFRRSCLTPVLDVTDDAQLDEHLLKWMTREDERIPAGRERSIGEMWQDEESQLIPLVGQPFDTGRLAKRKVTAYSLVRFETNRYSVPVAYVRQRVIVKCYAERVAIHTHGNLIAEHPRIYGREQVSFDLDHYLPLLERKARAFDRAAPVKAAAATWPKTYPLLLRILRDREGDANGTHEFIQVLMLHRDHSDEQVEQAVKRALTHEQPAYAHVWAYVEEASRQAAPPAQLSYEAQRRLPDVHIEEPDLDAYARLCGEAQGSCLTGYTDAVS